MADCAERLAPDCSPCGSLFEMTSVNRFAEWLLILALGPWLFAGCQAIERPAGPSLDQLAAQKNAAGPVPSEKNKTTLPPYVIEAPDILLIEAVKLVPKPPYHIEPLDVLQVTASPNSTLIDQPINGNFSVDPSGNLDLGPAYGRVHVADLTIEAAIGRIKRHLSAIVREPEISITLTQSSGVQRVTGEQIVAPDGTVNLGTYGKVYVAGQTLDDARAAIEQHLTTFLDEPQISLDVFAFNSKFYYIISEGAGLGDSITRVPTTGNETVLDAIAQINGLTRLASKRIWIARPAPGGIGCDQVLPVDWDEITKGAATATNYQVLPGDRVFIAENKFLRVDNFITNVTSPFQRLFEFSLLGSQAIQTFNRFPRGLPPGSPNITR